MFMIKIMMEAPDALFQEVAREPVPETGIYEILNGIPSVMPVPDTRHQRAAVKITAFLYDCLERKNRGVVMGAPCGVMLSSWDVVRPDVFFVRRNREGIVGDRIILGPPDLVVEVTAEDTWERDVREKRKIYADAGIQEYWIADPESETIEQQVWCELGYISTGIYRKREVLSSAFFPNLKLHISKVFAQ
jgi:Uma2 family endonuclease